MWLLNISLQVGYTDPLFNNFKANLFNGAGSTAGGRKALKGAECGSSGAELFASFDGNRDHGSGGAPIVAPGLPATHHGQGMHRVIPSLGGALLPWAAPPQSPVRQGMHLGSAQEAWPAQSQGDIVAAAALPAAHGAPGFPETMVAEGIASGGASVADSAAKLHVPVLKEVLAQKAFLTTNLSKKEKDGSDLLEQTLELMKSSTGSEEITALNVDARVKVFKSTCGSLAARSCLVKSSTPDDFAAAKVSAEEFRHQTHHIYVHTITPNPTPPHPTTLRHITTHTHSTPQPPTPHHHHTTPTHPTHPPHTITTPAHPTPHHTHPLHHTPQLDHPTHRELVTLDFRFSEVATDPFKRLFGVIGVNIPERARRASLPSMQRCQNSRSSWMS